MDWSPKVWLSAALVAAFVWFGTGLNAVWPLTWLIPVPLLWLAPRVPPRTSTLVAVIGYALGSLNVFHYYAHVIRLPVPILVLALLGPACLMGFMVSMWRRLAVSANPRSAPVVFGLAWVCVDYSFYAMSGESSAGFIAYSQGQNGVVLQLASIGGLWLIEFFLWWLPATVMLALHPTVSVNMRRQFAATGAIALALVVGYAAFRLRPLPVGETVTVTAMAIDHPRDPLATYAGAIAGQPAASYIVLPEKLTKLPDSKISEWDAQLARPGATVVAGLETTEEPRRNLARCIGTSPATYFKRHMVPGFEDRLVPGDQLVFAGPQVGVQICRDMGYPELSRAYATKGTAVMLVPAWDFGIDRRVAANVARMRAVEGGFSVVRASREGMVSVFDPMGRVVAETRSGSDQVSQVSANVPLRSSPSFYARIGEISIMFFWLLAFPSVRRSIKR